MANQIMAIAPYWLDELQTWVFDDDAVGLVQEPFVSGVPEMINDLVAEIPDARNGFRLLFSASAFPDRLPTTTGSTAGRIRWLVVPGG